MDFELISSERIDSPAAKRISLAIAVGDINLMDLKIMVEAICTAQYFAGLRAVAIRVYKQGMNRHPAAWWMRFVWAPGGEWENAGAGLKLKDYNLVSEPGDSRIIELWNEGEQ